MNNSDCDDCPICMNSIHQRGREFLLNPGCCGKVFHMACIRQALSRSRLCPCCRSDIHPQEQIAEVVPAPAPYRAPPNLHLHRQIQGTDAFLQRMRLAEAESEVAFLQERVTRYERLYEEMLEESYKWQTTAFKYMEKYNIVANELERSCNMKLDIGSTGDFCFVPAVDCHQEENDDASVGPAGPKAAPKKAKARKTKAAKPCKRLRAAKFAASDNDDDSGDDDEDA